MTINQKNPQNESVRNGAPKVGGVQWRRAWHGEFNDPRLAVIARRAGVQPVVATGMLAMLLEYASDRLDDRGSIDGIDVESLAVRTGLDDDVIRKLLLAFHEKGYLDDNYFVGWSERQVLREDHSTPRVQKFRAKERDGADETQVKRNETQRNAREEQTRETRQERADQRDQIRSDHTRGIRSDKITPERSDQRVEIDSDSSCLTELTDSAGGREDISLGSADDPRSGSHNVLLPGEEVDGAGNVIPFKRPTIPPALEEADSTAESNSSPPGESSELTLENLEALILPIFGDATIVEARNLLRASGPDAVLAVCREAELEPEVTRWRLMENAYADALNTAHPGINVGKVTGPLSMRDLSRRAAQKLGAKSTVHIQHLIALMDGDIDKALTAIEDAADGAAFDLAMERFASARPDVPVPSPWGDFSAAA